jgi:hypothetical protein
MESPANRQLSLSGSHTVSRAPLQASGHAMPSVAGSGVKPPWTPPSRRSSGSAAAPLLSGSRAPRPGHVDRGRAHALCRTTPRTTTSPCVATRSRCGPGADRSTRCWPGRRAGLEGASSRSRPWTPPRPAPCSPSPGRARCASASEVKSSPSWTAAIHRGAGRLPRPRDRDVRRRPRMPPSTGSTASSCADRTRRNLMLSRAQ